MGAACSRPHDAAPPSRVVALGARPACLPPAQQTSDDVLLNPDLQISLLDNVGVHGIGLGAINQSWSVAVRERRKTVWKVLQREPEKDVGTKPGQLDRPFAVAALPEGAVCVSDSGSHRLQIFSKVQGAAPRVIGEEGEKPGQFIFPRGVACDGTSLYVSDSGNMRVQKLRLADGAHLGRVARVAQLQGLLELHGHEVRRGRGVARGAPGGGLLGRLQRDDRRIRFVIGLAARAPAAEKPAHCCWWF